MTTIIEKETEQVVEPDHEQSEGLAVEDEAAVSPEEESDVRASGTSKTKTQGRFFHVARHYDYDSNPKNAMAGISEADWKAAMLKLIHKERAKPDVEFFAYIFHDKDVDPNTGNLVKIHLHMLIRYKAVKAVDEVRRAFAVSRAKNGEVVDNNVGASRYLTHMSDSAFREKKTIYPTSEVVTTNVDYLDMINDEWWEKKAKADLTADAKATSVGGVPLMVLTNKDEVDLLVSKYSLLVSTGQMRAKDAKKSFIKDAGHHWYRKLNVDFDKEVDDRVEDTVEHMIENGRELRTIYVFGAGGIGKTTLATKFGKKLSGSGGLYVTAPLGKDKTFDALNTYRDEHTAIGNEISPHGWEVEEFLMCFDPWAYSQFPSRNKNKHFIGKNFIFTNSISPMKFANDLLIYNKGGSQYQDPANPRKIDMSNKDAVDKYWQVRRRFMNIIALQRDESDATLVKAHVFNLRYGRYNNANGTPNMDDGDHVHVGTVSFHSAPGEAPVFTNDVLEEIMRLVNIDLCGVYRSDEVTIETYLEKVGISDDLQDSTLSDFIENVVSECKWSLLPGKFLYDLYRRFHAKYYPTDSLLNIREFTASMDAMLDGWEYKNTAIRTLDRMNGDEPLITEYDLRDWMNPNYSGSNQQSKRAFTRKDRYRGFVKK